MKTLTQIFTLVVFFLLPTLVFGQYLKSDINTELLSDLVRAKVEAAAKRGVFKVLEKYNSESINDLATKRFVENSLNILINEKNKEAMQSQILAEILLYSFEKIEANTEITVNGNKKALNVSIPLIGKNILDNKLFEKIKTSETAKLSFRKKKIRLTEKELEEIVDFLVTRIDFLEKELDKFSKDEKIKWKYLTLLRLPTSILKTYVKHLNIEKTDMKLGTEDLFTFSMDVEAVVLEVIETIEKEYLSNPIQYSLHFFTPRLLFNIGLNYGYFPRDQNEGESAYNNVQFASEKLGLQFSIFDWKYTRNRPKGSIFKYKGSYYRRTEEPESPFVSKLYWTVYGSGILYNIVDLKTQNSFSNSVVGAGLGIRLYNDLDIVLSYNSRFRSSNDKIFGADNSFINLSFDISIPEYVRSLKKK